MLCNIGDITFRHHFVQVFTLPVPYYTHTSPFELSVFFVVAFAKAARVQILLIRFSDDKQIRGIRTQ